MCCSVRGIKHLGRCISRKMISFRAITLSPLRDYFPCCVGFLLAERYAMQSLDYDESPGNHPHVTQQINSEHLAAPSSFFIFLLFFFPLICVISQVAEATCKYLRSKIS